MPSDEKTIYRDEKRLADTEAEVRIRSVRLIPRLQALIVPGMFVLFSLLTLSAMGIVVYACHREQCLIAECISMEKVPDVKIVEAILANRIVTSGVLMSVIASTFAQVAGSIATIGIWLFKQPSAIK